MRVALTGTPGTGKTTVANYLDTDLDVIHLNEVIREEGLTTGRDEERDTLVADLDAVDAWLGDRDDVLIESHLAHHLDADRVIVLRCRPDLLVDRLESRGESAASAEENAESEALDVILTEAVQEHGEGSVYEIDTTEREPGIVAADVRSAIDGDREPSAGTVSFVDYL